MEPYLKALKEWLPFVYGELFARDLATIDEESALKHLTVIIELPSKKIAVTAYESVEYQKMISLRTPFSNLTFTFLRGSNSIFYLWGNLL